LFLEHLMLVHFTHSYEVQLKFIHTQGPLNRGQLELAIKTHLYSV
jgi:hypothetical protein